MVKGALLDSEALTNNTEILAAGVKLAASPFLEKGSGRSVSAPPRGDRAFECRPRKPAGKRDVIRLAPTLKSLRRTRTVHP